MAMTQQGALYRTADPASAGERPQVAPGQDAEPPAAQCTRCGAVGTHYLTCPSLRLPADYRLTPADG